MNKITFDFTNRTALVTGGAQGFGLDIAKRFLKSGAKVIIWDLDSEALEKATQEINNPNLSSNIIDVSNYNEVESCVNDITKKRVKASTNLIKKLTPILEDYSKKNSIRIIVQKKHIVMGKKEDDITKDILELVNQKINSIKID